MSENHEEWKQRERKVRKDERKKVRGKKRAKGTIYAMLGALIAFLIAIFTGFLGLNPMGIYPDGSGSHSVINQETKSEPETTSDKVTNEEGKVRIIVKNDGYLYKDSTYDLEGMSQLIQGLETDQPIQLVGQYGDNAAFEEIESMLNSAGIDYNIVEDYK